MRDKELCILILLILAIVISPVFAEEKPVISLKYQNGLFDAEINSATIKEIFNELKKQTGMNYEIEKEIQEQKVTISLKDKRIEEAVKDILNTIGNPSYMLSYKKNKAEKYEVANINIRKRGSTEATQTAKRELQPGEMEVGLVKPETKEDLAKYRIHAKDMNINELLDKLSSVSGKKIVSVRIDKKIDFEDEYSVVILIDHIIGKIRPKIYKTGRQMSEIDRKGNVIREGYYEVTQLSDTEIQERREQAQLKNAEGERLLKQGKYLDALDAFGWGGDPDYINTRLNLGKIYLLNREFLRAIGHFNTALEIDSTNIEAWLGLIESYEKDSQIDNALASMEKYLEFEKDAEKANEIKKKIGHLKGRTVKEYYVLLNKGDEFKSRNEVSKAKEKYEKAIEMNLDIAVGYEKMGKMYEESKDYKKAEEMYKKVIEKDSKNFQAYTELAGMYAETGRTQDAIEMLIKAAAVCPVKDTIIKINMMIDGLRQAIKK
ncbi:MAG: tetratricopeptide repeat protein [bacterium]